MNSSVIQPEFVTASAAQVAGISTLGKLVSVQARARGRADAIVDEDRTLSWADLNAETDALAGAMAARGLRKGDRVAVISRNSASYVGVFIAAAKAGAVLVPVNPDSTVAEARHILEHSESQIIFASGPCLPLARQGSSGIAGACIVSLEVVPPGLDSYASLIAEGKEPPPISVGSADTCLILYTSGTTGRPKGVMHTHRSLCLAGEVSVMRMSLSTDDRMLCVLPFFHINALIYSLCGALTAGACLILTQRFSASSFWRTASNTRATQVNVIATIGKILAKRPRDEFDANHRITKLYGAPIPEDVYAVFRTRFGISHLIEGYGLTEVPCVAANPFELEPKIGSMGMLTRHPRHTVPFVEAKILDEEGVMLADGEVGELWVRSPMVMQGYYRDPEATALALVDGWFATGDLVSRTADGYFWFHARKKDIIRRRGENISGAELDEVISRHPAIKAVAAVPVPSELGEDEILVAAVLKPGTRLTEGELHQWCAGRLSGPKLPRFIAFVEALPHTPSHRVSKFRVREDPSILAKAIDFNRSATT